MEIIVCSVPKGKIVERGFLKGPYCPIYGFGALLVLVATKRFTMAPFYVFILAVVITTSLEFFSGYALEHLFGQTWWDYSDHKYNLMGYVCLKNAISFGVLSLLIVYFVHPFLMGILLNFKFSFKVYFISLALFLMIIDGLYALKKLYYVKEEESMNYK